MEMKIEEADIKVPKCKCDELEERCKKAEARILELELETEKKKSQCEALEAKCKKLEIDLGTSTTRKDEAEEQGNFIEDKNKVVDLTAEVEKEDIVEQLMVANRVLECEKRKAESEVVVWKEKFKELEQLQVAGSITSRGGKRLLNDIVKVGNGSEMKQLQVNDNSMVSLGVTSSIPDRGIDNLPASGTPYKDSPCSHASLSGKYGFSSKLEEEYPRKVRRNLSFDEERCSSKKIAPTTPGIGRPTRADVINIFDSDDEFDTHNVPLSNRNDQGNREVLVSTDCALFGTVDGKKDEICCQDYEEDMDECKDNIPCRSTSKRKRAAKIVTSDTESDEDDNIPISKLKKVPILESIPPDVSNSPMKANSQCAVTPSKRRLVTLRQREEKVSLEMSSPNKTSELKYGQGIPITDDVDDDASEQVGSASEGESADSFIVDSSDASDADNIPSQSENESDQNMDYRQILSQIQRSKGRNLKWELEGDMLSAFGKDLELCMRAVCALYRQQTSDEQVSKETKYENNRGFSKFDASRGTDLAEFLIDGDPQGDLKKSVQQLKERGSSGVELCRTLATRYSKQLFQIYKNKEDPLFLPC